MPLLPSRNALRTAFHLLLATVLLLVGCQERRKEPAAPATGARNIVLITVDTLRADRLSPYGHDIATPALQRLADEGVLFEAAYCDVPWTLPSMSSVMSGSYPTAHGVRTWRDRLGDQIETLPEQLRNAGYRTAAIVGSFPLDRRFGLAQGFDHYDDEMTTSVMAEPSGDLADESLFERDVDRWMDERSHANAFRTDDEVTERATRWLASNPNEPFFLWVHYFGPHEKDKRPEGHAPDWVDFQLAIYDEAVAELDAAVSRLLDQLRSEPRFARTAVLLHADHGQSLMERGTFGHGPNLYDGAARVPLIVRLPEAERAGERVPNLVRNLDLFPTVLELAGLPATPVTPRATTGDGHSLLKTPEADSHIYLETHHWINAAARHMKIRGRDRTIGPTKRGIRTSDWKFIVSEPAPAAEDTETGALPADFLRRVRTEELYRVSDDPIEKNNLAASRPDQVAMMRRLLERHTDRAIDASETQALSDEERARLRAIGYSP